MSPKDAKDSERDLEVEYWVSSPYDIMQHELLKRIGSGSCFFFADHGNKAFQVALGVNSSEEDQPSPRKIAHLMAKESQDIL
eukprot:14175928-Ditylum_brightwellii.AAC.1